MLIENVRQLIWQSHFVFKNEPDIFIKCFLQDTKPANKRCLNLVITRLLSEVPKIEYEQNMLYIVLMF